jgi:hypothetical protein
LSSFFGGSWAKLTATVALRKARAKAAVINFFIRFSFKLGTLNQSLEKAYCRRGPVVITL